MAPRDLAVSPVRKTHIHAANAARMRWLRCVVALALGVAAVPVTASAHAVVLSSQPAANAVVAPGTLRVRLQFTSRIDPARSRLALVGPDGKAAPIAITTPDAPGELAGQSRVAAPGRWQLQWQVLSLDGHVTRGDIPFDVRGGEPAR